MSTECDYNPNRLCPVRPENRDFNCYCCSVREEFETELKNEEDEEEELNEYQGEA